MDQLATTSESYIDSHHMPLLWSLSSRINARPTGRAKVVREVLGSKAVLLRRALGRGIWICQGKRSTYLDCLVIVVKGHVSCLGVDHEVAVDMANGALIQWCNQ